MSIFEPIAHGLSAVSDFVRKNNVGIVVNPPLTQTASSHSVTIRTDRGIKIGRIQSWAPSMTRTVDTVFEVQQLATGEPLEKVSQIQSGNRISVERFELYTFLMGEAFGTPVTAGSNVRGSARNDLVSLTMQTKPFNVREVWRDPFNNTRAYVYVGCVFSDLGYTISATDDRIIKARATLEFVRRLRLA